MVICLARDHLSSESRNSLWWSIFSDDGEYIRVKISGNSVGTGDRADLLSGAALLTSPSVRRTANDTESSLGQCRADQVPAKELSGTDARSHCHFPVPIVCNNVQQLL